jgi:hypothetical protein
MRDRRLNLRVSKEWLARVREAAEHYDDVSLNDLIVWVVGQFVKKEPLPAITIQPTKRGRRKKA